MGLGSCTPVSGIASPQAPLGSQPCHYHRLVEGGGLCMGFLGAGVLRWGQEASEGCSGPRPVCRRDHVFLGGDLLLPDWGLCPWDPCLPLTPLLPCGQLNGRREGSGGRRGGRQAWRPLHRPPGRTRGTRRFLSQGPEKTFSRLTSPLLELSCPAALCVKRPLALES